MVIRDVFICHVIVPSVIVFAIRKEYRLNDNYGFEFTRLQKIYF